MKKSGFTLVELVVVIWILAVLSTLWFLSYQWYSWQSRDAKRVTDIEAVSKALTLRFVKNLNYPNPDNFQTVSYNSTVLRKQGIFWKSAHSKIAQNISELPLDPLYNSEYIYSTTSNNKQYQIMYFLESDLTTNKYDVNPVYAQDLKIKIVWNYNNVALKTGNYIVPTPSIITSEPLPLELSSSNIWSQVISGWKNIPNINQTDIQVKVKQMSLPNFSVFSWSLSSRSDQVVMLNAYSAITQTYSGTPLASQWIIQEFLNKTQDEDKIEILSNLIIKTSTSTPSIWNGWGIIIPPSGWSEAPFCTAGWQVPCKAN